MEMKDFEILRPDCLKNRNNACAEKKRIFFSPFSSTQPFNPLTTGPDSILFLFFY